MERLTRFFELAITPVLAVLAPAVVQAVTSWFNRDTAKAQLEAEKLRQKQNGDDGE